jgi:hypothetical protein
MSEQDTPKRRGNFYFQRRFGTFLAEHQFGLSIIIRAAKRACRFQIVSDGKKYPVEQSFLAL